MYEVHQPKSETIKVNLPSTGRSALALGALLRKAGPHKANGPKGGARNNARDYINEYLQGEE